MTVPPLQPKLTINPGDEIEAQGKFQIIIRGVQTQGWHSQIIDETTGVIVDTNGFTPAGFNAVQDSGAFLLSSDGKTLASFGQIQSGGVYTGVPNSNVLGPYHGGLSMGAFASQPGETLVMLSMPGTTVSSLSIDGSSFTIT